MKKNLFAGALVLGLLAFTGSAAALTDLENLGKKIYMDTNLSANQNQSCMTCHHPGAGFADPENRKNPELLPVSEGSLGNVFGGANAPTSAYAGFSPILDYTLDNDTGEYLWTGGMFWNGRATGWTLNDPLAEQALGPFLNPREMAMDIPGAPSDPTLVVTAVQNSNYARLFEKVFSDPSWNWQGWNDIWGTYDLIGRAIAAFERSKDVTAFSSLFDAFFWECETVGISLNDIGVTIPPDSNLIPQGILDAGQLSGLALFNDPAKGNCAACHTTTADRDLQGNVLTPPLFTDFSYDNLGIPTNPRLYELFDGAEPPDLGLGGFLATVDNLSGRYPGADASEENGKFKVPTLRNVSKNPPYGHNGYFVTLTEIVDFYNTRDVKIWPAPEYAETMNTDELGDLGLSDQEVRQIVGFMKTLNDN